MKPAAASAPALLAFLLAGLVAGDARATDDKETCVRAVEHAQVVRLDGKLREAREGFVTCARAVCPEAIRRDCEDGRNSLRRFVECRRRTVAFGR